MSLETKPSDSNPKMSPEKMFEQLATELCATHVSHRGKLFGKPCISFNGKAFLIFFNLEMVFKLTGDDHKSAKALPGARLFDPSGKKRFMQEWVQVPPSQVDKWPYFAKSALKYVAEK